jgi:hypothetical protein
MSGRATLPTPQQVDAGRSAMSERKFLTAEEVL